jgi:hypothetical protein
MQGSQSVVYLSDENDALWAELGQKGFIPEAHIPEAAQPDPT